MIDSLASETTEEREARLQQMRDRLASDITEEREGRLQQMCDGLAFKTMEERKAWLQQMSAHHASGIDWQHPRSFAYLQNKPP